MYTMMQVCRETDMTYQTLKYYCNEGLIPNVKRDKNNRRVFDEHDVKWIKDLVCLKKCALSEFWDRAHYPRYSTIRGNFQIVAIYKDFKEISSDNLSLHDTVKVTKENRRL